jgi:branched-chain amino acid transport system ATP-binding protein
MNDAAQALKHPVSGDTPDTILNVTGLTRGFGGASVIEGLDLTLCKGEVLGIIGPNGAGKTTFFNLIAGVLAPSAGKIVYRGRDISQLRTWDRCRLGIGRTYQIPKPFAHMSVFENVLVPAVHGGGIGIAQARACAEEALELSGLADMHALPAGALPLLDLKRLELCRAIALDPQLLLLDEIAGGLTDAEADVLLAIIGQVNARGATIIWIEHVLHALQRLSTRIAVLFGGRFLADGEPAAVLADPQVRAIYLGTEP